MNTAGEITYAEESPADKAVQLTEETPSEL